MVLDLLNNTKAILFDLDGTLINSLHVWAQVDIEFLGRFGYAVPDDYEGALMGMSFYQVAEYTKKRFNIPLSIEEIMNEWNRMAEYKYEFEIMPKDYAVDFIKNCYENDIKMGICTSNSRHLVEKLLCRIDIDKYMSVILTGDEIKNGKPAPDIYLEASKRLDIAPNKCMVFEDVIAGIEAGHNAGMRVCAVNDELDIAIEEKKKEIAEFYISGYEELLD